MMLDGERGTREWGSSPIARTVVDDLAWFASLIVRASLSAVNRQVTSLPQAACGPNECVSLTRYEGLQARER
jgi:hypothetical protein